MNLKAATSLIYHYNHQVVFYLNKNLYAGYKHVVQELSFNFQLTGNNVFATLKTAINKLLQVFTFSKLYLLHANFMLLLFDFVLFAKKIINISIGPN